MKFEKDVRDKVSGYLKVLLADPANPDTFQSVLDNLTRMSMLGTAPPSCQPKYPDHGQSVRASAPGSLQDDFSERKESFIAP